MTKSPTPEELDKIEDRYFQNELKSPYLSRRLFAQSLIDSKESDKRSKKRQEEFLLWLKRYN